MWKNSQSEYLETVILANGEFPTSKKALKILQDCQHIVCCDGAAKNLLASGIRTPEIIIGDLDSISSDILKSGQVRIIKVSEQETNDLHKAFRFCMAQGWRRITILGATGLREDHTLGNISLLADFALKCPDIQMITDFGEFHCIAGSQKVPCHIGQQVSIFSIGGGQRITSRGLKYQLDKLELENFWYGTLNECVEDSFELTVEGGKYPILIYLPN